MGHLASGKSLLECLHSAASALKDLSADKDRLQSLGLAATPWQTQVQRPSPARLYEAHSAQGHSRHDAPQRLRR